jgi:hypothetical protein
MCRKCDTPLSPGSCGCGRRKGEDKCGCLSAPYCETCRHSRKTDMAIADDTVSDTEADEQ